MKKTTKIILIRHGETSWNACGRFQGSSDIELSAEGLAQAERLADHYALQDVAAVYASDLKRAYKTAEFIAAKRGLSVRQMPLLREISFGDWEGLTYEEIAARWPEDIAMFYDHPEKLAVPKGESFAQAQSRAVGAIWEICRKHPAETVAVVAHGGVTRTILAEALHMPLRYVWSIKQENTAVNIIRYNGEGRHVELVNSTCHLFTNHRDRSAAGWQ